MAVDFVCSDKRIRGSSFNLFSYLLIVHNVVAESMFTATYFSSACRHRRRRRQRHTTFIHPFKWCWCTHLEHFFQFWLPTKCEHCVAIGNGSVRGVAHNSLANAICIINWLNMLFTIPFPSTQNTLIKLFSIIKVEKSEREKEWKCIQTVNCLFAQARAFLIFASFCGRCFFYLIFFSLCIRFFSHFFSWFRFFASIKNCCACVHCISLCVWQWFWL